jgi:hypothetical protein
MRRPWVTQFTIEGREYGGHLPLMDDIRIEQFFQSFPSATEILELGSLEGAHTFALAMHPGVKRVIGVEGRRKNHQKARYVQKLLKIRNVSFQVANLETSDLTRLGKFDAIFCSGILYHLPRPWELVERMSRVSDRVFVWTHYVEDDQASLIVEGLRGGPRREYGLDDPLSGLSDRSFWPTFDSLLEMFRRYGFTKIEIINRNLDHIHGPETTLAVCKN